MLVTLAFPGLLANTSDFMTDLPGFAADAACLALGAAALGRQGRARWACLAASAAVGCFGFSVREFGLAAPIAVLVTLAVEDRRRWRAYCLVGLGVLVVCGAIYLWTAQLPGAQHVAVGLPGMSSLRALVASYFTLCFAVSPLLPTALRRAPRADWRPGTVAALAALAVGTVAMVRGWSLFSGNYLTQQGASGASVLPGGRPNLFPGATWTVLQAVALVAGTGVAFVAGSGVGRRGASAMPAAQPAPSSPPSPC